MSMLAIILGAALVVVGPSAQQHPAQRPMSGRVAPRPPALSSPESRAERDALSLARKSRDLVRLLEGVRDVQRSKVSKHAGHIASLARKTWSHLQSGRTNGALPKSVPGPPRPPDVTTTDAWLLRRLALEIGATLAEERESRNIDLKRRLDVIQALERINEIALRIQRDTDL